MSNIDMDQLAELIMKKMQKQDIQKEETSRIDTEISDLDERISYFNQMHDQLVVGVRSVIPDEEPHTFALQTIVDWLNIARMAQVGEARIRRDALRRYTEDEIEAWSGEDIETMLRDPVDWVTFLRQRVFVEPSSDAQDVEYIETVVVPPADIRPQFLRRELIEHAVTGGVSGGLISLLVSFLWYLFVHGKV